jgi:hypothetical protein
LFAGFDARDDAPNPGPAAGAIIELQEAADFSVGRQCGIGRLGRGIARLDALCQANGVPVQRLGAGQTEELAMPGGLAPVHDLRAGIVAVAA